MEQALDAGIVTMGGGGDFPRNVMCSPLSGVEEGEYFRRYAVGEGGGRISDDLLSMRKRCRASSRSVSLIHRRM